MKAKSMRYSIQNPCDESWNDMKPESSGRFCNSCEKSVIDFTNMSDFSIVNYLENHKNEKVCGRFTKPQLDRVYHLNQTASVPNFDLRAVVLGLALATFSAVPGFAQTEPQNPIKIDTTLLQKPVLVVGTVAIQYFDHQKETKVSGIIDASNKDFDKITIQLKDINGVVLKNIHPDSKGKFSMDLNWKLNPAYLNISGPNYETQELYFHSLRTLTNIRVELQDQPEIFKGEVIQGDIKATEE